MKCNAPLTIQMLIKCQHHSYSPLAVGYATLTNPTKSYFSTGGRNWVSSSSPVGYSSIKPGFSAPGCRDVSGLGIMAKCPVCETEYTPNEVETCSVCGYDLTPYPPVIGGIPSGFLEKEKKRIAAAKRVWQLSQSQVE